jgi:large subunit ribosomal protein L2
MPLVQKRPITPGQRHYVQNKPDGLSKKRPERGLTVSIHRKKGRNNQGRITSRRKGGGHKRLYRIIDFKRSRLDERAEVIALEYDPNRSANIALIQYADGEKHYILAPEGLKPGASIVSSNNRPDEFGPGDAMPLSVIPPSTRIHNIELVPGRGGQIARAAGNFATLVALEGQFATVKLPSGELRYLNKQCRATIGHVGNINHGKESLGKAGRNRWLGKRPRVRGVAMNPVDHPMGGGEGRTSGGGHPVSPWGQLSKGFPTRKKKKPSNRFIIVRRNGRKVKKG